MYYGDGVTVFEIGDRVRCPKSKQEGVITDTYIFDRELECNWFTDDGSSLFSLQRALTLVTNCRGTFHVGDKVIDKVSSNGVGTLVRYHQGFGWVVNFARGDATVLQENLAHYDTKKRYPTKEALDAQIKEAFPEAKPTGRKDDGVDGKGEMKDRWDLIPWGPLVSVVKVITHGAKKYGDDNWQKVLHLEGRYFGAAMRHVSSYWTGEENDPDSGLPHLAHAMCGLMFLLWKATDGKRGAP